MLQALELLAALLIIGAFAAQQLGRMDASSAGYQAPNAVGSGLLAALALRHRGPGFCFSKRPGAHCPSLPS